MSAATGQHQMRQSGSSTAPATQKGAEAPIQISTRRKCWRSRGVGAVAAIDAGAPSDSSIGMTNSQGPSSNAWAIPAFMNRPRPITATVTASVPGARCRAG